MVLEVKGLNSRLGSLGFVEVLIDRGGLRLAKPNKVDYIGKDLDEAIMGRLEEVIEGEIFDTALGFISECSVLSQNKFSTSTSSFLSET